MLENISLVVDEQTVTYGFGTLMTLMHHGHPFTLSSNRGQSNATITTIGFDRVLYLRETGMIITGIDNSDALFTASKEYQCVLCFDKATVKVSFVASQ